MHNLDQITKKIDHCKTLDEAFDTLEYIRQLFKFDYYLLGKTSTYNSPSTFNVKILRSNYPQEWVARYLEKSYFFIDPIAKMVMANDLPFYWSESLAQENLDEDTLAMIKDARHYGLCDGVGVSYLRNKGNLFTLTFTTDRDITDYDRHLLCELFFIGSHFVSKYEELTPQDNDDRVDLTDQEKRVVTYAASGKTDSEIALILEISVNTIRYHWKNIFDKFECYNRVIAVIQAMNMGLIDASILKLTTESGSTETYHNAV